MVVKSVQLALGNVYYLEGGNGRSLLFLHGAMATSQAYMPLLDRLEKHYHVIAPVHPGHGKTFAIPKGWKLRDYVLFYHDFFEDIGFVPDILIGHSFGGVLALVLASGGLGNLVIAMDAPGLRFRLDPKRSLRAIRQEGRDVWEGPREQLKTTARAASTILETIIRHPEDVSLFATVGPHYTIASQVKQIHIPTYLLWGEKDGIVPVEDGKRLEALIPGSRLIVFPGRGHNYSVTDPEFTYKQIASILPTYDNT